MNAPNRSIQRWDARAQAYTERNDLLLRTSEQQQKWSKLLQALLDHQTEAEVLDVGTGPGFLALQMAKMGYRTSGVDLSTEMLRIAMEKARTMKLRCTFIHADAEALPFAVASFDVVVSRHLLGALSFPERAFTEWKRVLKPGGKVVVMDGDRMARNEDPFAPSLPAISRARYKSLDGKKLYAAGTHKQSDLQERIVSDLGRAGFIEIRTHTIADLLSYGNGRYQREHYQRIIVTGQKPRSQGD